MKKTLRTIALFAAMISFSVFAANAQGAGQTAPAKKAATAKPKAASTPDKEIGKDEKGHTMFEGKKGGKYYINENGKKVYMKNTSKAAPKK